MAQECGFFNAQLVGEDEYDRVYLAEQFAAYFASFIGNGIFGKSMQKLEVLAQTSPDMSVKVLSGEAWINGWWYRNTEEYTLPLDVADGVLSRIDAIVLRWGNRERDMWLHVIKGVASSNPIAPSILRDADYYDLQLAMVSVSRGTIKISQSAISDTRLNNNVCGLVTGVVDQIDTTNLYNQFEQYFKEFKERYEKDYADWTAEQKAAYQTYIAEQQKMYDDWIANKQNEYEVWTSEKMVEYVNWVIQAKAEYTQWIEKQETDFTQWLIEHQDTFETWTSDKRAEYTAWVEQQMSDFTTWSEEQKEEFRSWSLAQQLAFRQWYDEHTTQWQKDFTEWFEGIKAQLAGDVAGALQLELDKHKAMLDILTDAAYSGWIPRVVQVDNGNYLKFSTGEFMMFRLPTTRVLQAQIAELREQVEELINKN